MYVYFCVVYTCYYVCVYELSRHVNRIIRIVFVFFFKQKTAYEMRISDWSSDVCSSDLARFHRELAEQFPDALYGSRRDFSAKLAGEFDAALATGSDRKRVVKGKSVSVRVDLGGRRIIKKKRH